MSVHNGDETHDEPAPRARPYHLPEATLVLYVDPAEGNRAVTAEALRGLGATVVTCASATEAMDLFGYVIPSVLVVDVALLDKHGYWLIKQVRRREPRLGGRVLAIAITDPAEELSRLRALATEFDEVCAKPCDAERLASIVGDLLSRGADRPQPVVRPEGSS